jgi:hypothetical protein
MIIDGLNKFCEAQAMPNNASAVSTNVIDLGILGKVRPAGGLNLVMIWTGTPASDNNQSLQITLRSGADDTNLASSPTIHWSTGIILATNFDVAGFGAGLEPTVIALPTGRFNPNLAGGGSIEGPYKRYLALWFTGVNDCSDGLLTAALVFDADVHRYAPSGYVVA